MKVVPNSKSQICENLYFMANIKWINTIHKGNSVARRRRDEEDVQKVIGVLKSG